MIRTRSNWMPLFLLALMLAGTGWHVWHHATDPDCDSGSTHSHPCLACSALHGATVAETALPAAPPEPPRNECPPRLEGSAPRAIALGIAAPRAPPIA